LENVGEELVLAIDLGTSNLKAALVTVAGEIAACETLPLKVNYLAEGGAEQDAAEWWRLIQKAGQTVLAKITRAGERVIAVSLTAQWSGTVAVDEGGSPLRPAIIWLDSRGGPFVQKLTHGFPSVEGYGAAKLWKWIRLTGGAPSHTGKDSLGHILYLKNREPEIYRKSFKFFEPKDYLNFRLTGRIAATFDSITLHWVTDNRNPAKIVYDPGLLKLAGIARDKLPDLVCATDVLGPVRPEVASGWGLTPNTPVIAGTPDFHSAALGSGAVLDYEPHLSMGTSSWFAGHVPFKKTDLTHNLASLPSPIPGRYILADEQECAGACLTYLRDQIFFSNDELTGEGAPANAYELFDRMARRVPAGSSGLIFTPWLYGERTPVDDRNVRSSLFNQSLSTTRAHLIRAAMEGVAYNSRWLLDCVERFMGRRVRQLNMFGGGAKSALWCQILADVLGRTIRQIKDPLLTNARGAAFLAAAAVGKMRFEDIPARVSIERVFEPIPGHRKIYNDLFREFLEIYRRNRPTYAGLHEISEGAQPAARP
jgi:xylulokinase